MMKSAIVAVLIFSSIYLVNSLQCYEGAPDNTKVNPNCQTSCEKNIDKTGDEEVVMYGCSEVKHDEDECKDIEETTNVNTVVRTECFCNSDLCNSTATISSSIFLLSVALLMKMAF
ncbi:uncharacterized protein LOC135223266 [Macrobrachium nipponense]|uniref:uncharacterized protein LOC135223266 n=1 Tax=Macrobrachium nipponense TaxID=159736 RepID=UPI0030C83048